MHDPFQADNLSILPGIRHGFYTRQGGISTGLYKSLNCGAGSKDDPVAVNENRSRVAVHLGSFESDVQTIYQVHSADAIVVDTLIGRDQLPKADALVTRTRGLAIGILTADCCPVLFADPEAKVVGAAHAGWRGAFGGVIEATVKAMESQGATRGNIFAAYGPTINQAAYEVGPEFEAEFANHQKLLALVEDSHCTKNAHGHRERMTTSRSTLPTRSIPSAASAKSAAALKRRAESSMRWSTMRAFRQKAPADRASVPPTPRSMTGAGCSRSTSSRRSCWRAG